MSVCGESMDMWLGLPPASRPRCANGHRERYMEGRARLYDGRGGWQCRKCKNTMTWTENLQGPHNAWWRERRERLRQRIQQEGADATS